jgi:hypothetical protein
VVAALAVLAAGSIAATAVRFGDGTHLVGRDIPARTYRAATANDGCYWARLRNFSGGLNSIISNANPSGPELVTIKSTDRGFETARCGTWTSDLSRITKSRTRFGEGTYLVGVDIAPGTYTARGSGCYWARLRGFTGDLNSLITNANPTGRTVVTITRSDRGFTSSRCGTWTRL